MKNRAKGFKQFLNEVEEPARDEVQDLKRLRELGLVENSEYITNMIDIASRSGQDLDDLLEPDDILIDLEGDSDTDSIEYYEDFIRSWRGPKGERVVIAKAMTLEAYLKLNLLLSSGTTVSFELDDYGELTDDTYALKDGHKTQPSDEDWDEALEDYDSDYYFIVGTLLSLIVSSSY